MECRYTWQTKRPAGNLVCSRDGVSLLSSMSDPKKSKEEGSGTVKDHKGWPEGWSASSRVSCEVWSIEPSRDIASTNREQFGKLKCWVFKVNKYSE